ncbi:MAG: metal ABC transporter permease [Deltaproteobacteria bacterium]|nr:metal ABC transporter permease [Deltaproteobacteria bacterium]
MSPGGMTLQQLFGSWDLFGDTLVTAAVAGALLGALGVYVVMRRMVFVSAALSQAAGLGVVLAHALAAAGLLVMPPEVGAAVLTLAAALLFVGERREGARGSDGLLGWLYLVGAGGILVVGSRIVQELPDVRSVLFGTAVAVTPEDASRVAWLAGGILLLHAAGFRGFVEVSTDRTGARVRGLPVRVLEVVLILSLALAISLTTRVLGALPVFAFSVLPALAALRVATNVPRALLLAAGLGAAAGFWGYVTASVLALPVGATQALAAAALVPVAELVAAGTPRVLGFRWREAVFMGLTLAALAAAGTYAAWRAGVPEAPRPAEAHAEGEVEGVAPADGEDPWSEDLRLREELYTLVEEGLGDHCALAPRVDAWFTAHEDRIRALCVAMEELPLEDPQRYMDASVRHARALGGPVKRRVWDLHHRLHDATGGCEHLEPLEALVHRYDDLCNP